MVADPTLAWECSGTSVEGTPDPCIVYAQRRSQAKKVAHNHGPGFDMIDFTDIRCRRRPAHKLAVRARVIGEPRLIRCRRLDPDLAGARIVGLGSGLLD